MKEHILVISQYFYPEEFRINDICKQWVKRGHQSHKASHHSAREESAAVGIQLPFLCHFGVFLEVTYRSKSGLCFYIWSLAYDAGIGGSLVC